MKTVFEFYVYVGEEGINNFVIKRKGEKYCPDHLSNDELIERREWGKDINAYELEDAIYECDETEEVIKNYLIKRGHEYSVKMKKFV